MDGVQAPQVVAFQFGGIVEQHIVEVHEGNAVEQLTGTRDRTWTVRAHRADHLHACQRARSPLRNTPKVRGEGP